MTFSGVIRKKQPKRTAVFIDGVVLDRASKRQKRKINMAALVKGITSGQEVEVVRYYTLIPNQDDSRQRAFLDALQDSGISVQIKRLPPKGVQRLVSLAPEMCADIVAFSCGKDILEPTKEIAPDKANLIFVCPTHELSYAINLANQLGAETTSVDFSTKSRGDVLKSAQKWIDLSQSETIWMQED